MAIESDAAGPLFHERRKALRILFVDADPILREFAVVNLSGELATVDTAPDGEAAIAAIQAHLPDIVLLDVETPKRDGFEVIQRLRRQAATRDLPIVVVTGREDVEAVERAYEAGAGAFVVKPLNWRLLTHQLRYVLRAARAEQAAHAQLRQLAAEGARFAAVAMALDPALRPAAASFVRAAETALEPDARGRAIPHAEVRECPIRPALSPPASKQATGGRFSTEARLPRARNEVETQPRTPTATTS